MDDSLILSTLDDNTQSNMTDDGIGEEERRINYAFYVTPLILNEPRQFKQRQPRGIRKTNE